ncbi:MAG: GDSL-type esterase/lipase family protein [Bacteroidales bacterium]|jgi:lysophospholipase L1-like esterase|nr:GDSL-type esterase/lipase family protein [Bacteroidales bacterium]
MRKLTTLFALFLTAAFAFGEGSGPQTAVLKINNGASTNYKINGQSWGDNALVEGTGAFEGLFNMNTVPSLGGMDLGTPTSIILEGAEVVWWGSVTDVNILNYRVYKAGTTPPAFSTSSIPTEVGVNGDNFRYSVSGINIDLYALATDGNGTYNLEIGVTLNGNLTSVIATFVVGSPTVFENVTLKVTDKTKGELTAGAVGAWSQYANIVTRASENLRALNAGFTGDPVYGLFDSANWYNGATIYFPKGHLEMTDEAWVWQVTFSVLSSDSYWWSPLNMNQGWAALSDTLHFSLDDQGNVTGDLEVVLGDGEQHDLTFQVDMTDFSEVTSVWVTGSFCAWTEPGQTGTLELTDTDADGIYTGTINVWDNPTAIHYKYVNGTGWGGIEEVVGNCTESDNRVIVVNGADVVIPVVKFASCDENSPDIIRVACIGNSNTAGAGASNAGTYAWPIQLRNYLSSEDYATSNFGVSGATLMDFPDPWGAWTNNIDNAYSNYKAYNANTVLVALGTNDSKTDYWSVKGNEFATQYLKFIDTVKKYASTTAQVWMITPIKALDNTYGISNDNIVNGVIPAIAQVSATAGIPVIDWYSISKDWTTAELNDGVHAGDASLGLMAQKVSQILLTQPEIAWEGTVSESNYAEYRWYKDGVRIDGANGKTYNATEAGRYKLAIKLTETSEDVVVSNDLIVIASLCPIDLKLAGEGEVAIERPQVEKPEFSVSPNPVTDRLLISDERTGVTYRLLDMRGSEIVKTTNKVIDVSRLRSGVYMLSANGKTVKIIKK